MTPQEDFALDLERVARAAKQIPLPKGSTSWRNDTLAFVLSRELKTNLCPPKTEVLSLKEMGASH